jgi:hypothetical protein
MSDANLLAFGCAVTFIAVAGVYVYLRECWEGLRLPPRMLGGGRAAEKARGETRGGRAGKPSGCGVTAVVRRVRTTALAGAPTP